MNPLVAAHLDAYRNATHQASVLSIMIVDLERQRRAAVFGLKRAGLPYEQIAEEAGLSVGRCRELVFEHSSAWEEK